MDLMYRLIVRMLSSANRLPLRRNMRYHPLSIPGPFRGVRGMEVVT
jgi:hypothetical protein